MNHGSVWYRCYVCRVASGQLWPRHSGFVCSFSAEWRVWRQKKDKFAREHISTAAVLPGQHIRYAHPRTGQPPLPPQPPRHLHQRAGVVQIARLHTRRAFGQLTAEGDRLQVSLNGNPVGEVAGGPQLCQAVFEVYLGQHQGPSAFRLAVKNGFVSWART